MVKRRVCEEASGNVSLNLDLVEEVLLNSSTRSCNVQGHVDEDVCPGSGSRGVGSGVGNWS